LSPFRDFCFQKYKQSWRIIAREKRVRRWNKEGKKKYEREKSERESKEGLERIKRGIRDWSKQEREVRKDSIGKLGIDAKSRV